MIKITHKDLDKIALEHFGNLKNKFNKSNISNSILEEIILAEPKDLLKIDNEYKRYENKFKSKYRIFIDTKQSYNAYELIKKLNIIVCPYCNRNTIYNLKHTKRRTSEIDHFYPKSEYPILSLSFYNLIPSCSSCNRLKSNKINKYINPYDNRYDFNKNIKFDFKVKNLSFSYSTDGFKIICKSNKNISKNEKRKAKNNIQTFKLNDLYQNHKDIVLELIQKREIYPDSYIDELYKNYDFFNNREDVLRFITSGYIGNKDLGKRPLSKLIKDISEELELI